MLISAAFLGIVAWNHVPRLQVAAWLAGLCVILVTRFVYCRRVERLKEYAAVRRALRTLFVLSIANGTTTGMAVVLFFHHLPADLQAIFSMVIVCWAAGAVSANVPSG